MKKANEVVFLLTVAAGATMAWFGVPPLLVVIICGTAGYVVGAALEARA